MPATTGSINGANITLNAIGLAAPTAITPNPVCAGNTISINDNFAAGGCSFSAGNTFTVDLYNAAGTTLVQSAIYTSPITLTEGTLSGITIPTSVATGSYTVLVRSSNPVA